MERETRFELATFALARQRSTTEPLPRDCKRDYITGIISLQLKFDNFLIKFAFVPVYFVGGTLTL